MTPWTSWHLWQKCQLHHQPTFLCSLLIKELRPEGRVNFKQNNNHNNNDKKYFFGVNIDTTIWSLSAEILAHFPHCHDSRTLRFISIKVVFVVAVFCLILTNSFVFFNRTLCRLDSYCAFLLLIDSLPSIMSSTTIVTVLLCLFCLTYHWGRRRPSFCWEPQLSSAFASMPGLRRNVVKGGLTRGRVCWPWGVPVW